MLGDPAERVRPAAHDDDDRRRSGSDDGLDELLLHAGKAEVGDVAELAARAVGHQARAPADDADRNVGVGDEGERFGELVGARAANAATAPRTSRGRGEGADARERRHRLGVVGPGREVAGRREQVPVAITRLHDLGVRRIRVVALQAVARRRRRGRSPRCARRGRAAARRRCAGARTTRPRPRARAPRSAGRLYARARRVLVDVGMRRTGRVGPSARARAERSGRRARRRPRRARRARERRAVAVELGQLHVEARLEGRRAASPFVAATRWCDIRSSVVE